VKLIYFAWVRQKVGVGEETVEAPREAKTVGDIAAWLKSRGGGYADAFADLKRLRAAVNQEHADFSAGVRPGDEVAFFPPVTGG
jgi:molybdopterin synthase sulfur carrier subunit